MLLVVILELEGRYGGVRESKCSPTFGVCYAGEDCSYANSPVMFASDHCQIKA